MNGGLDAFEVGSVRLVVGSEAEVVHQRGEAQAERAELGAKLLALGGGKQFRLGGETGVERELHVVETNLRTDAEGLLDGQGLHAIEAEAEADAAGRGGGGGRGERGQCGGAEKVAAGHGAKAQRPRSKVQ